MTLDQLKVLDIIIKTGSFRAASAVLHRAQSAVSYSIKTLEEELGIVLFDRSAYRPKLTVEGRAIHNKARAILAQAKEFEVLGRQLSLGTEAVLDISVTGLASIADVVGRLKNLPKVFPDTQLNLYQDHLRLPYERVLNDTATMAISPPFDGINELEKTVWKKIRLYPVCAPDFPARERTTKLSWADMLHYVQIVVMDPPIVEKEVNANVVEGAKRWRVTDFQFMKELVLSGVGWAYMPAHLIETDLKRGKLARLNLEREEEELTLFLIRKPSRPLGPCGQYVWELLG